MMCCNDIIDDPVRVAITGITGRMGRSLLKCIIMQQKSAKKIFLGAAITKIKSSICGMDVGIFMKSDPIGIVITDDIESVIEDFDVLIDFTVPIATMKYVDVCVLHHKNMVIGTTGLNKDNKCIIVHASRDIGIVMSSNFSIGITVMLQLLEKVSKKIGSIMDVTIIETHHNKKLDIPSGTALMMHDIVKKNKLNRDLFNKSVYYDNLKTDEKKGSSVYNKSLTSSNNTSDIPIHSIRTGSIVGEHTVLFTSANEQLKITHQAFDRMIFAYGALFAAGWLGNSKIGLFNVNDVLGFNI